MGRVCLWKKKKVKKMSKNKCLSAREIFRKRFPQGAKNFMTPKVEGFGKVNCNVAYELSSGRGFENDRIYGVTVISFNPKKHTTRSLHDVSKGGFPTKVKAESYIGSLVNKFKIKR